MLKKLRIPLLSMLALFLGRISQAQELINRPDTGQPLRWEYLFIVVALLFIIFRFFGVKGNDSGEVDASDEEEDLPPPPPPPPPSAPPPSAPPSRPLMVQASEAIGDLQEVGKNVHVGGKRMSGEGDAETYLMMAKLDKSYIRKEEQLIAEEKYADYESKIQRLTYIIYGMGVAIVLLLWEVWLNIYLFIATYVSAWLNG